MKESRGLWTYALDTHGQAGRYTLSFCRAARACCILSLEPDGKNRSSAVFYAASSFRGGVSIIEAPEKKSRVRSAVAERSTPPSGARL
jgi:hypothetical protein